MVEEFLLKKDKNKRRKCQEEEVLVRGIIVNRGKVTSTEDLRKYIIKCDENDTLRVEGHGDICLHNARFHILHKMIRSKSFVKQVK